MEIEKVAEVNTQKKFEITKSLKCPLTQEELLKAGEGLTEAVSRLQGLEDEKQSLTTQYKAKIAEADAQVNIKRTLIQCKYEFRPIKCDEIHDFSTGTITIIRLDTKEVIDSREMTMEQRQGKLDFEGNS